MPLALSFAVALPLTGALGTVHTRRMALSRGFSSLAVFVAVAALLDPAHPAAAKSYTADRFDITARLLPDRSLTVEERIVFRFDGGDYTYVFREIPRGGTDGIFDVEGEMDGVPFRAGMGPGTIERKEGRSLRVTWHFRPVRGTHAFTLRYRLAGVATRNGDEDRLAWHVLPGEHAYRIGAASATVELPAGSRFARQPRLKPSSAEIRVERAADGAGAGRLVIGARNLGENGSMTLDVRLARGALAGEGPLWQREAFERSRRGPWLLLVGGTVILLGLGWLAAFRSAWRRPDHDTTVPRPPQTTPPDPLLPIAIAARLAGRSGHGPHFVAAMVDLAARGVIAIEDASGERRFGGRQFLARLAHRPPGLRPHEAAWLDLAFGPGAPRGTEVSLASVHRRFANARNGFRRAVQEDMRALGLIDPERVAARQLLVRTGMVALAVALAGGGVAILLARTFGAWAIVIPVSSGIVAASCGIAAANFSILTRQGARLAEGWQSYFAELRRMAKDTRAERTVVVHADWLPYAVAAAVGAAWVRRLVAIPGQYAPPAWFRAATAPAEDHGAAFVAFVGTHASSSHAAGGGGGGGGAAGGGASGAG
jgi:hypothetical protein